MQLVSVFYFYNLKIPSICINKTLKVENVLRDLKGYIENYWKIAKTNSIINLPLLFSQNRV